MTTNQENKFTMYQAVIRYLSTHETMLNALPHFTESFAQFKELVGRVEENKKNQETQITGITKQKNEWREDLIDLASEVAGKVKVYATFFKNAVLKQEIAYSESTLRKTAHNVLKDRAQIIHDKAKENLAQLAEYRVTQELLDKLAEAIQKFSEAMPSTRVSQIGKKGTTLNLRKTFAEIDVLLKERLDGLMQMLRKEEAQFYTGYTNARIIIDLRARGKNKEIPPENQQ
ncbi:MAG: hypothetical protein NW226_20915 [Microscillaceae bacterium]|nr:hypothetical protein [Microscillaceae bacterium]